MRYFDILKKRANHRQKYLDNLDFYLEEISSFFKNRLGSNTKVYLFGSVLTDDFVAKSDIDVLVVSENAPETNRGKAELIDELDKTTSIEFVNPFEFHIVSQDDYENWYSHFIKDKKEI